MTPVPGSVVQCRKCNKYIEVPGADPSYSRPQELAVPASKVTGAKRARGFYCRRCADKLGALRPKDQRRGTN